MGRVLLVIGTVYTLIAGLLVGTAAWAGSGNAASGVCGGGGTADTVNGTKLSAEQLSNAQIIVATTRQGKYPNYAAVVAVATAMTESTLHNYANATDHDSLGLFQQRVSVYGADTATDPRKSTLAFLSRLVKVADWKTIPLTQAAQAVQRSAYPDRYAKWQALAEMLTGRYWPGSGALGCDGGQGPAVKGHGTTTIPKGLRLPPNPKLAKVVQFAIDQIGKPYVWDRQGPDSYDCSGLMVASWAQAGVPLPTTTFDQVKVGIPVAGPRTMLPGDMVFIMGADPQDGLPGHVGMYVGTADGVQWLVHAPQEGETVKFATLKSWGPIYGIRRPVPADN